MIPRPLRALLIALSLPLLLGAPARAEEGSEEGSDAEGEEEGSDDTLAPHRMPFDVLVERTIGATSRPVEYNWRRSEVQVAMTGDHLFELNNFNSLRSGALVRLPSGGLIVELGASWVWTWDTPSSTLLALTPYRQPGRPPRIELDAAVAFPLAEGVVTTWPRFFPAVQMVFNAYGGLRYLVYPGGFAGMRPRQVGAALLAPQLTETELANLEDNRLDAMQIDTGRYGLMVGLGNDLYFRQGLFVSPRLMLAVPLLAPATGTELLFWADLSLAVGVAF